MKINWGGLMNINKLENTIETVYRELENILDVEYMQLYTGFSNEKLQLIFSTLHSNLTNLFTKMNTRLPTGNETDYYWADDSRALIKCFGLIAYLENGLQNTMYAFKLDQYYESVIKKCQKFLCKTYGSTIPAHMEKIELYYTIPVFCCLHDFPLEVSAPKIQNVDRNYISNVTSRALIDIENNSFDSALTKSRTLIEETFCYVIELHDEIPNESGNIKKLYGQVKNLYNMHTDTTIDKRINMLLSGLEKILTSISEMRNEVSDSHGVGKKRIRISEHHARLFVNSAMVMADFILSIGENYKNKKA